MQLVLQILLKLVMEPAMKLGMEQVISSLIKRVY